MAGDTSSQVHVLRSMTHPSLPSLRENSDSASLEGAEPVGVVPPEGKEPIHISVIGSPIDVKHWMETNKAQFESDFRLSPNAKGGIDGYIILQSTSLDGLKDLSTSTLRLVVGTIPKAWGHSFTDDWMQSEDNPMVTALPPFLKRLRIRQHIKQEEHKARWL